MPERPTSHHHPYVLLISSHLNPFFQHKTRAQEEVTPSEDAARDIVPPDTRASRTNAAPPTTPPQESLSTRAHPEDLPLVPASPEDVPADTRATTTLAAHRPLPPTHSVQLSLPLSYSKYVSFLVCPDGTQAAGGCVNGLCGTGYTCSNGLCCAGTSTTVKCLDGSDAVGACIPSCQGDGCGGVQVSYYCGSGYTCTTGNICCPINSCPNGGEPLGPTINGLCPTGYTVQGNLCCSATCADGSAGTASVNGVCPTGFTLTNGVCCASALTCSDEISIGPCTGTGYNGGCPVGYSCDSNAVNCCPVVDYTTESCQVGPAIDGLCPPGYVVVYIPNSPLITNGVNPGTCIDVQCSKFQNVVTWNL